MAYKSVMFNAPAQKNTTKPLFNPLSPVLSIPSSQRNTTQVNSPPKVTTSKSSPSSSVAAKPSPVSPTSGGGSKSSYTTANRMENVGDALNPFSNNPIPLINPFGDQQNNIIFDDIGMPVRGAVRVSETALAAIGGLWAAPRVAAMVAPGTAGFLAKGAQIASKFGAGWLIPAGLGVAAGGLLFGGGSSTAATAPQTSSQSTTQNTYSTQNTTTNQNDYRQWWQVSNIINSPYAGASQGGLFEGQAQSVTPTQTVTPQSALSNDQAQEASTSSMNWGLIALAIGGVYLLSRGK